MIRHAFTLIWHRKKANALIMLELLVTFLILFGLAAFGLNMYRLYSQPLGFNVANTWSIRIATGSRNWSESDDTTLRQVRAVVEQLNEVGAVETMSDPPFDIGGSSSSIDVRDVYMPDVNMNWVSSGFPEAVGMQLVEGRWFGPGDEIPDPVFEPVLVNRAFSATAGGEVVGIRLPFGETERVIVGVFDAFRQHGDFSPTIPAMLQLAREDDGYFEAPILVLLLKPGVPRDFEERLSGVLQSTAPEWDFDVASWETLQRNHVRLYIVPLLIGVIIVLFLLVMVGFGMLGVLWQNIIRRTPEMGLRRAMGAKAGSVRLQVVLELLAVACFALVLGLAIALQLPLTGVFEALDWGLFFPAAITSTLALLGLCTVFALYPSYQATCREPVDALRYE